MEVVQANNEQIPENKKEKYNLLLDKRITQYKETLNPFKNWDMYNPSPEMLIWRQIYEKRILETMKAEKRLEYLRNVLSSDIFVFCDECKEMKCYGALYPICEPVQKKILEFLK